MGLACWAFALAACSGSGPSSTPVQTAPPAVERAFDFAHGNGGWLADFADYAPDTAPTDVVSEIRSLPALLPGAGYYSAGTNRSDDLFIYIKTRIDGLTPLVRYQVAARVDFLTQTPSGCLGVGGSPGESVWIVVGASTTEPLTVFNGTDYRVNIDRGNQAQGGTQGVVLGNLANTVADCGPWQWQAKSVQTAASNPLFVNADDRGAAWILVGFDSGYESFSSLYYQSVRVRFTPAS